jgi:hypothetical protein
MMGFFPLRLRVKTGHADRGPRTTDHSSSHAMGTGGSSPGGKAAGAWKWPLASIWSRNRVKLERTSTAEASSKILQRWQKCIDRDGDYIEK